MTHSHTATAALLDLTARAAASDAADSLRQVLQQAHALYCAGLEEVRAETFRSCADLSDDAVAERCRNAGAVWEVGMERSDAIADLAFSLWDRSPAALAYGEIADRATDLGVGLVGE
ncbi:hypothetical protein ACFY0Z_30040 [Streptomyces kronopolitis]|uniref:hypothetical protein n=1 Tax=Streptomyces kronopolitis TaxID=1612435 RepID=UPI003687442A